jgi:hypothetical protein
VRRIVLPAKNEPPLSIDSNTVKPTTAQLYL